MPRGPLRFLLGLAQDPAPSLGSHARTWMNRESEPMAAGNKSEAVRKIGLLWRGDRAEDPFSTPSAQRLKPLMATLQRLDVR